MGLNLKEKGEAWLEEMRERFPAEYAWAESMFEVNESGEVSVKTFVMLGFGGLAAAIFVPLAIDTLQTADTGNFTPPQVALFSMIGIAILIAAVMIFVNIVQ